VSSDAIGMVHPGEMGAAVGAALRERGHRVLWASHGRSAETAARAAASDLEDVGSLDALASECAVVLSVCPPHAALDVARSFPRFGGIYVDANAVSPATARDIEAAVVGRGARFVDGGLVGPPPAAPGTTRLYLSGPDAGAVAAPFADAAVEARVVSDRVGAASAVKMAYAAWTKGSAALLLAIDRLARREDVADVLADEWRRSQPEVPARTTTAERQAASKGWRWAGEMDEIAATFAAAGLPDGFHRAAAEVYRWDDPPDEPGR
jgi:3-hydroxyisobutyrate dehydrogenase-like beta-hydroxyacid dehydrogenase